MIMQTNVIQFLLQLIKVFNKTYLHIYLMW